MSISYNMASTLEPSERLQENSLLGCVWRTVKRNKTIKFSLSCRLIIHIYFSLYAGFAPAGSVITFGNVCICVWFELLSCPSHVSLSNLLLYLVFFHCDSVEGSGCLWPPYMQQSFSDTTLYLILCQMTTSIRLDY